MKNVIATFENAEDGVTIYVATVQGGYSVSLQDTDSGEFLPSVVIYQTEGEAMAKGQAAAA